MKYRNDKGREVDVTVDPSKGLYSVQHEEGLDQAWPDLRSMSEFLAANGFTELPESEDDGEEVKEPPTE